MYNYVSILHLRHFSNLNKIIWVLGTITYKIVFKHHQNLLFRKHLRMILNGIKTF